mgnify:CR=1 FL=1
MATIQDTLVLTDQYSPALNNYIQSLLRAQNAANQTQNANRRFSDSASEAARSTSSFASSLRNLAGAYLGVRGLSSLFNLSDTVTQTTARLDMMNDGLQTTAELNRMIYESAQRSRGAYQATANMVSKLGNLAGEAFSSNKELVDFAEQLNKQITLSGASTVAADAAMLQLTQAMSSGVLRGEELNSILEQTPTIAKTIAEYMGVSTGQMREMASEGLVTSTVVKNALLGAAEEVNAKFEQMPMTWGQVWTSFKNTAIMAVQPVLTAINWMANNIQIIGPLVLGAAGAFAVFQIAAHWTTIATAATAAYHFVVNLLTIGYGVLTGSAGAASAAVFTFNSALLASPITWVVMGVMLLVGALYAGVAAYNKLTDSSVSATGIIAGAFYVLGSFVLNSTIIPLQRGFASFANFIGNVFNDPVTAVKVLFYDMSITVIGYIQSLVGGIEDLINAIPGVEINLTSGIDSLYNRLQSSRQAAISAGSYKEYITPWEYKDLGTSFANGYKWGSNLNLFSGENYALGNYDSVPTYDQVSGIADSVSGIQKSMEMTDEDLQSLVDIAERRYVNNINLTSQAPVINITGQNTGNTAADRQNLANALRDILVQQVAAGSEQTTEKTF